MYVISSICITCLEIFVSFISGTTGVIGDAGTANPSGAPHVFCGVRGTRSLVLCVVLCRSLFVLLRFLFTIVLSVLRFIDSGYPICIFKFF